MLPARARKLLLASLLIPPLAGCKTLTGWTEAAEPASTVAERQIFFAVPNYAKAPCEYQRAWAAHNSKVATLKDGREVVLKAPCDVDPRLKAPTSVPAKAPAAQPKTS